MTDLVEPQITRGRPLVRKIAVIMAEISRVPKRGRHSGLRYDYVQEADLMDLLRDRMADQGVVIFPSVREHNMVESRDDRGRVQFLTTVTMEITLIDSESGDQLTTNWIGQGMDPGDKGYYKAYTGAIKYFLLKTFLISTGDEATTPMPAPHERRERHPEATQQVYQPAPTHVEDPAPPHDAPVHDEPPHHEPAEQEPPLDEYPEPDEVAPEAPATIAEAPVEEPVEEAPEETHIEEAHIEEAPVEEEALAEEPPAPEAAPEADEPVVEEAIAEEPVVEQTPAAKPAEDAADEPEPARVAPTPEPIDDAAAEDASPPLGFSEDPLWQDVFEQLRGQLRGVKAAQREKFFSSIAAHLGLVYTTELSPEQLMEELELIEALDGDARKAHIKDPTTASRPDSLSQQFMAAAQDAVPAHMVVGLRSLYLDKMGAMLLTEVDDSKLGAMVKKLNKMSNQERADYITHVLDDAK
jgi:hypothetical protein